MQLLLLSHHIVDVCEKMNGCQKDVNHDRRILLIREQVKHLKKQFLILQHSIFGLIIEVKILNITFCNLLREIY